MGIHFQSKKSRLDAFISYNWSVPRDINFLALATHYNWNKAFVVTLVVACICVCLGAGNLLPFEATEGSRFPRTWVCMGFGSLTFVLLLAGGHEFYGGIRCGPAVGRCVFWNTFCMPHTAPGQQDFHALETCITNSDTFTILFSETYFEDIWTLYEACCFLLTNDVSKTVFIPLCHPMLAIFGSLCMTINLISLHLFKSGTDPRSHLLQIDFMITSVLFTFVIRRFWWLPIARVKRGLSSFGVHTAECSCHVPCDPVNCRIIGLMKQLGIVDASVTDEVALDIFERMITEHMTEILEVLVGRVGIPYRIVLCMFMPGILTAFDVLCGQLIEEHSWARILVTINFGLMGAFCFYPCFVATLSVLTKMCPEFHGLTFNLVFTAVLGYSVSSAWLGLAYQSTWALAENAVDRGGVWIGALVVVDLFFIGLTIWLYQVFAKAPSRAWLSEEATEEIPQPCPPEDVPKTSVDTASLQALDFHSSQEDGHGIGAVDVLSKQVTCPFDRDEKSITADSVLPIAKCLDDSAINSKHACWWCTCNKDKQQTSASAHIPCASLCPKMSL